jgi:1-acyl-sn-glycerol-3-phosphate acyltransferase
VGTYLALTSLFSKDPQYLFKNVAGYMDWFMGLFGISVVVEGKEHLDPNKGFLVISNHQSFLDIPVILKHVCIVGFFAKIELKSWPFFGFTMNRNKCIFVNRKEPGNVVQVAGKEMQENVAKGFSYCVFAEGTRTLDGNLLPFKGGIVKAAKVNNVPILPFTIQNTWDILPKKPKRFRPDTIRCVVHAPVNPEDYETTGDLLEHVRNVVQSGFPSQKSGEYQELHTNSAEPS